MRHFRRCQIDVGLRAVGLVLILCIALGAIDGPVRAGEAGGTETIRIVIAGPAEPAVAEKAEVQLRVFEGEDPDAPPNVTNIAVENRIVERLAFPITLEVAVPKARLTGAMRPAVGAIIIVNGAMTYWTEAIVPLNRAGATELTVTPVD